MLAGHEAFDHLLLLSLELIETEKLAQTLLYGGTDERTGIDKGVGRRLHLTLQTSI